jgi:hypothetical protein
MPSQNALLYGLSLLSCLLTLAASGDDFCLLRLIFPATLAQAEPLPLDDPNADFLASTDSWAADAARADIGRGKSLPGFCPWIAYSIQTTRFQRFAVVLAGRLHISHTEPDTPRRC